jgi:hypothetical protein
VLPVVGDTQQVLIAGGALHDTTMTLSARRQRTAYMERAASSNTLLGCTQYCLVLAQHKSLSLFRSMFHLIRSCVEWYLVDSICMILFRKLSHNLCMRQHAVEHMELLTIINNVHLHYKLLTRPNKRHSRGTFS